MILPDAITNEAEKAARATFSQGISLGWQMIAATITEIKVIRKFTGRKIFIVAVSFSINSNKMFITD